MVLHPHTKWRQYCSSLGPYKESRSCFAWIFLNSLKLQSILLQKVLEIFLKLHQAISLLKTHTKSHCTGKHRELLTPPYNFTFESVVYLWIPECHSSTCNFLLPHMCSFVPKLFFFFISLPTWHLTDTEPIIMNYSKNTFIATFSLSYMTQLRKSTLINPSTVTTLKQKEKKSLYCTGLFYVLLSYLKYHVYLWEFVSVFL